VITILARLWVSTTEPTASNAARYKVIVQRTAFSQDVKVSLFGVLG
jgi:hypothetical protein